MPEPQSTKQKLNDLKEQFQTMRGSLQDLSYKIRSNRGVEDESLSLAQAELDQLTEKINSVKSEIEQLEIIALIEDKIEMVKALMPVGKFAIDSFKDEAKKILNELVGALVDLREGIDDQLARLSKINAQSRFRQFSDLKDAGFSDDQAFMLTLASVHPINWSEMAQRGSQNVSATKSRSR